jgi:hypothetical protein
MKINSVLRYIITAVITLLEAPEIGQWLSMTFPTLASLIDALKPLLMFLLATPGLADNGNTNGNSQIEEPVPAPDLPVNQPKVPVSDELSEGMPANSTAGNQKPKRVTIIIEY